LGGLLALCAAATFAFNNTLARRGVLTGSVFQAMAITVPLGVPLMLVAALIFDALPALNDFTLTNYVFFAAAGIAHFVFGRYCNYRAVKAIGANLSGPLTEVSVLFALVFAVTLLGEKLTIMKVIGIALILAGPLLTVEKSIKLKAAGQKDLGFTPHFVEGYIFSLLAAAAYGTSPILVRMALEHANWHASIAGGLVSYGAAALVVLVAIPLLGQVKHVAAMPGEAMKWFCWAGFFVGLSQLLRYIALSFAPVSVVSPIQRLSLVFRLVFSYMLNRRYEVFDSRMIVGTFVSLLGAVFLSMSIDNVRDVLDLPTWMDPLFVWTWP
jgi:drug/metabolite transporter (DMT)-like permease